VKVKVTDGQRGLSRMMELARKKPRRGPASFRDDVCSIISFKTNNHIYKLYGENNSLYFSNLLDD
jgi:hypothetical protein